MLHKYFSGFGLQVCVPPCSRVDSNRDVRELKSSTCIQLRFSFTLAVVEPILICHQVYPYAVQR